MTANTHNENLSPLATGSPDSRAGNAMHSGRLSSASSPDRQGLIWRTATYWKFLGYIFLITAGVALAKEWNVLLYFGCVLIGHFAVVTTEVLSQMSPRRARRRRASRANIEVWNAGAKKTS